MITKMKKHKQFINKFTKIVILYINNPIKYKKIQRQTDDKHHLRKSHKSMVFFFCLLSSLYHTTKKHNI